MTLIFDYADVKAKFEEFVSTFVSPDKNVNKQEIFPKVWTVALPQKGFSVMITCEMRRSAYGFEDWLAVVEEPNGEKSNFLLFEDEIEHWLAEQRRLRGIK